MKQKIILFIILLPAIVFSGKSLAQTSFELPQDIELNTKEDYAAYESTLVAAATWLEQTDLDKYAEKRKEVNTFIVKYLTGTPDITIGVNSVLTKLTSKNIQLLTIYLASYGKYVIENKNSTTQNAATKAALTSIINVYKRGIGVVRSKEMEKISNLSDAELEKFVLEKFN